MVVFARKLLYYLGDVSVEAIGAESIETTVHEQNRFQTSLSLSSCLFLSLFRGDGDYDCVPFVIEEGARVLVENDADRGVFRGVEKRQSHVTFARESDQK